MPTFRVVGIDPAPSKGLMVFDPAGESVFTQVPAIKAREWCYTNLAGRGQTVVTGWDAPLTAEFTCGYYERPVEKLLSGMLGDGVSVRAYAGCPHWAITQDCLGLPFKLAKNPNRLRPVATSCPPAGEGSWVVETHPAVSLAMCWPPGCLPHYKYQKAKAAGRSAALSEICQQLASYSVGWFGQPWIPLPTRPASGWKLDDYLDAQVAYLSVVALLTGKGIYLGDIQRGGFAVPATDYACDWQRRYDAAYGSPGSALMDRNV